MYPNVQSSSTYNSQKMETSPKGPPTGDWFKMYISLTHTNMEYYSAIKKNVIL